MGTRTAGTWYEVQPTGSGVTRRVVLSGGALGALGLLAGPAVAAPARHRARRAPAVAAPRSLKPFLDRLPAPPTWSAATLAAQGLTMAEGRHRFHRQLRPSRTWGYGGLPYLGPTIEVAAGQPVSFSAHNALGAHPLGVDEALHGATRRDQAKPRTSLHLHGGYVAPEFDGHPEDTFRPGESQQFEYPNDQQSGTVWYHDHALGITRLNVYAGLAGGYLVRDEYDTGGPGGPLGQPSPLGLAGVPLERGGREVPLVLQDKTFAATRAGGLAPLYYPDPWEPEFFGDLPVVNGKVRPYLRVDRAVWRFRLLNGSSSRFYTLRLTGAAAGFLVIGTATGLLPAPVAVPPDEPLVMAPGERYDVLVDLRGVPAGARVRLVDEPLPEPAVSPAPGPLGDLLELRVTGAVDPTDPPATLRPFTRLDPAHATGERTVTLVEIMGPDGPVMALLNNRRFDHAPTERPSAGDLEIWNLVNLTEDTHPIHLHLAQFQLLDRQPMDAESYLQAVYGVDELTMDDVGSGPDTPPAPSGYVTGAAVAPRPWEVGWTDTVQAHPGAVTRIAVPFSARAFASATGAALARAPFGTGHLASPLTGEYVWHCHILDHEDHEMMRPYLVTG